MIKLQIWTFQEFSVICCRMICQDRWCASKVKHNSRLFCGLWCQHHEWTQCCNSRRSMLLSMSRRLLLYFSSFCCWSVSTHQLFSDKLLQTKDADLRNEEWNHVRFIESFTTEDESTREKEAGQIWTNVVIVCKVTFSSSSSSMYLNIWSHMGKKHIAGKWNKCTSVTLHRTRYGPIRIVMWWHFDRPEEHADLSDQCAHHGCNEKGFLESLSVSWKKLL